MEDLWETVLRSECPPDQAERLLRMKQLSDPVASDGEAVSSDAVAQLIREMDLVEAIAAARAFSLYFQLVNILEQRIEEDSYLASMSRSLDHPEQVDPFAPPLASQTEPASFRELFERLRHLNVPPAQLVAETLKVWQTYRMMGEATEEQLEAMGRGATPVGEKAEEEVTATGSDEAVPSMEGYVNPFVRQS